MPQVKISASSLKLALVSTAVLVVLVVFSQATKLENINVAATKSVDKGHLQRVAEEAARKQWFGRNLILLNTGDMARYIEENEPGIKEANIKRTGLHSVEVAVTERQPTLNWKTNGIIYLLDVDGTVIGESKGVYLQLPTVVDSTNLPVELGDRVAPSNFVTFCAQMAGRLPEAGLAVGEMVVPETTTEINIKTTKGFVIKMDTTRTVDGELTDLRAVQGELQRAKKTPTQYIDLRIENKAYYK